MCVGGCLCGKSHTEKLEAVADTKKHVVCRHTVYSGCIGEGFGRSLHAATGNMVTALRLLGFDVLDTFLVLT
jgi:hypothetical protein